MKSIIIFLSFVLSVYCYPASAFGTGVDGNLTVTLAMSPYVISRDYNFQYLTIETGVIFKQTQHRIYVSEMAIVNGSLNCNGNDATGPTGASGLPLGTLGGSS